MRLRSSTRSQLIGAVVLALSIAALTGCMPTDPTYEIELPAPYEVQSLCDPSPKPGTEALAALLRSRYPGTNTSISRPCDSGGRSEHKEGRAIDWGGVSAFNSTQKARVQSNLDWLLATDAQGHQYANARRLGIMYIIWNAQIWVADDSNLGWQPYECSGVTLCHQDHVHMSLSQAGAQKRTSYWTGTTGEAWGQVVAWLDPRTGQLTFPWTVEPGHEYRIVAHGAFHTSNGARPKPMADAMCATATDYDWSYNGGRISVDGSRAWTPETNTGGGCNLATHSYSMILRPTTAHQPVVRVEWVSDLSQTANHVSVTLRQLN